MKHKNKQDSPKEEVKVEENAAKIVKTDVAKMMDFPKIYSDWIKEMHGDSLGSEKIKAALMEAARNNVYENLSSDKKEWF
jgi:hypothetical protein